MRHKPGIRVSCGQVCNLRLWRVLVNAALAGYWRFGWLDLGASKRTNADFYRASRGVRCLGACGAAATVRGRTVAGAEKDQTNGPLLDGFFGIAACRRGKHLKTSEKLTQTGQPDLGWQPLLHPRPPQRKARGSALGARDAIAPHQDLARTK